jgi:hypothetical protein
MKYIAAFFILFGWALNASAQADIEGSVEITTGNFIAPSTVGRTVITITNNGPETAVLPAAGTNYVPNVGFRTIELLRTAETAPCVIHYTDFIAPPGQLSRIVASVKLLTNLAPGESVSCVVEILVYPEAPAIIQTRFSFASGTPDTNQSNNVVFLAIRTRADLVQAPSLTPVASITLALSVLLLGVWSSRQRIA